MNAQESKTFIAILFLLMFSAQIRWFNDCMSFDMDRRTIQKSKARDKFARAFKEEGEVLLVIAHPDDEAMFFTPTILALRDSVNIHVMSLSNGDYAGLGWVRASELVESCRLLGIPKERVSVVDDPSLQVSFLFSV